MDDSDQKGLNKGNEACSGSSNGYFQTVGPQALIMRFYFDSTSR